MDSIFVFGGSFDPVHMGHLILAQHCSQALNARVVFLPTGNPPHKTIKTQIIHRYNMLRLAIGDNPNFEISTYETDRQAISYTYQTVEYLKRTYNKEILFFVGGDSLEYIYTWKEPKKLLDKCTLVYAKRLGYELDVEKHLIRHGLNPNKVREIDTPVIEISSTEIRNNIKNGYSIKYLVPKEVEMYIYKYGLYK